MTAMSTVVRRKTSKHFGETEKTEYPGNVFPLDE